MVARCLYSDTTKDVPGYASASMAGGGQPRRQIHGYVSKKARDGWYGFAEDNSVNVTALLEAMGVRMGELRRAERLPTLFREIVREAMEVAGSRSSRRRTVD